MLILLPTILLLGLAGALGAVRFFRPRSRFLWVGALGAVLGTWLIILIWRFQLPISLGYASWGTTVAMPEGLEFSIDSLAWVIAWSLAGLLLAGLVVGAAETDSQPSASWVLLLLFGGLSLLASSAANAVSLVLVWGALDLGQAGIALASTRDPDSARTAVAVFAVQLATLVIAVMAQVLEGAGPATDSYALLMLTAVVARTLVQWRPRSGEAPVYLRGSVGTALQLSSAIATLSVLPRLRLEGGLGPYGGLLLLLCAAVGLYAGWMWLRSPDLRTAFPHAVTGISMLAAGTALLGNAPGTSAWVAALALGCGVLFLAEGRKTGLAPAVIVGAWSLSALPFSLTGAGWPSQFGVEQWALPAFLLAQALILAGFLQSAAKPLARGAPRNQATSLQAVRNLGIVFLMGIQVLLGVWGWQGAAVWQALVPGAIATVLGAILFAGRSRLGIDGGTASRTVQRAGERFVTLMQDLALGVYSISGSLIASVTGLLEGEAGIMWGLLILALFVSLIVGGTP
jgi:hypothetical protein